MLDTYLLLQSRSYETNNQITHAITRNNITYQDDWSTKYKPYWIIIPTKQWSNDIRNVGSCQLFVKLWEQCGFFFLLLFFRGGGRLRANHIAVPTKNIVANREMNFYITYFSEHHICYLIPHEPLTIPRTDRHPPKNRAKKGHGKKRGLQCNRGRND